MNVDNSSRKNNYIPEVFHSRHKGHFHVNLVFYILEYFGLGDDADSFIPELFTGFSRILKNRRNVKSFSMLYFGGIKQLRSSIFYQVYAVERKKMTAAGIAIKYGVSYREVHRGLRSAGYKKPGGWARRVIFRGVYED